MNIEEYKEKQKQMEGMKRPICIFLHKNETLEILPIPVADKLLQEGKGKILLAYLN